MTTPTVTELRRTLEPTTTDDFALQTTVERRVSRALDVRLMPDSPFGEGVRIRAEIACGS